MSETVRLSDERLVGLNSDPEKANKGSDTYYWDQSLKGFGLKITGKGTKVFVYQYKIGRDTRRMTLGNSTKISAKAARALAEKHRDAVRAGRDPQAEKIEKRAAQTIKELTEAWVALLRAKAKRDEMSTKTVTEYAAKVKLHIVPAFGSKKPIDLTPKDIKAWRDRKLAAAGDETKQVAGKRVIGPEGIKGTLRVLSAFCGYLQKELELIPTNPAQGLGQFATAKRERFLTHEELGRLGSALEARREQSPHMVAAIELALFSGMREGEILGLKWDDVREDEAVIILKKHKTSRQTGSRRVQINDPTSELLKRAKAWRRPGNPFVFPSQAHRNVAAVKSGRTPSAQQLRGPMSQGGLRREWRAIRKKAGLDGIGACRFHDLRHTYASIGVSSGISLSIIGKTLGHTSPQTTARYGHIYDDAAHIANAQVGDQIKERMSKRPADTVVPMQRR